MRDAPGRWERVAREIDDFREPVKALSRLVGDLTVLTGAIAGLLTAVDAVVSAISRF